MPNCFPHGCTDVFKAMQLCMEEISIDPKHILSTETNHPSQDVEKDKVLQSEECTSHNQNASEVGLTPTIQTVQQDDRPVAEEEKSDGQEHIVKEEQLQPLTEEDALVGDSQEDKDSETSDKQKESAEPDQQPIPKKCITFSALFDPKTLEHTVCINASIQPKVTLEVKMLPPDKIASEEHLIDHLTRRIT